jgi:hypothetical protein
MTNAGVLQLTYAFLKAQEHGGAVTTDKIQNQVLSSNRFIVTDDYHFQINTKSIPSSTLSDPIPVTAVSSMLPLKYTIASVLGKDAIPQDPFTSQDTTQAQLAKDYKRDRLIINGKRILGSACTLDQLISTCDGAMKYALQQKASIPTGVFDTEDWRNFITTCLRSVARTDSAFLSHAVLNRVLDLTSDPDDMLIIVPESVLAAPIEILFSILERHQAPAVAKPLTPSSAAPSHILDALSMPAYAPPPVPSSSPQKPLNDIYYTAPPVDFHASSSVAFGSDIKADSLDWCIMCQAQASMVFRICSSNTLKPLLQVQTTYRNVIHGMPKQYAGNAEVTYLETKQSSSIVHIGRELRTSDRDWS